jgi:hypothetical protein
VVGSVGPRDRARALAAVIENTALPPAGARLIL